MRGIELKHIGVRSFRLKGLTARWGIDGDRPPMPPALRASLVAWYNTEIQRATNFDVIESYAEDFTANKWTTFGTVTRTNKKATMTNTESPYPSITGVAVNGLTVAVSGITGAGNRVEYRYIENGVAKVINVPNGVQTVPACDSNAPARNQGFFASIATGTPTVVIEQLPTSKLTDLSGNGRHLHLYGYTGTPTNGINADGWLQSAGAGYGVSYGQPILTDYTVCSTRRWNTTIPAHGMFAHKPSSFMMERTENSVQYTYSFNAKAPITFEPREFTYQSSRSYNGTPITKGASTDTDTLILGRLSAGSGTRFDGSYKSFVLFNRTLTAEELAYVKRWMA